MSSKNGDVKFVRIRGRVVPIRQKPGASGGGLGAKEKAAGSYHRANADYVEQRRKVRTADNIGGTVGFVAGAVVGGRKSFLKGVAGAVVGSIGGSIAARSMAKRTKAYKKADANLARAERRSAKVDPHGDALGDSQVRRKALRKTGI